MTQRYVEPTQAQGAALFQSEMQGELVMLNLIRLRDVADYSLTPQLTPSTPLSGAEAYELYVQQTLPFLEASGGELLFSGKASAYFIGPSEEQWDRVLLVKQRSLHDFLGFASNPEYLKVLAHRQAAVLDTRLLPIQSD